MIGLPLMSHTYPPLPFPALPSRPRTVQVARSYPASHSTLGLWVREPVLRREWRGDVEYEAEEWVHFLSLYTVERESVISSIKENRSVGKALLATQLTQADDHLINRLIFIEVALQRQNFQQGRHNLLHRHMILMSHNHAAYAARCIVHRPSLAHL